MVGGELQEVLQQVVVGGDVGVQDYLLVYCCQLVKNLLQVVLVGVVGYLWIVLVGVEQLIVEKGIVDIDGIYWQGVVQLFEFLVYIFVQQIVQFVYGYYYLGMVQCCGVCWMIVQIDFLGLWWVDWQGGIFLVVWFWFIELCIQLVGCYWLLVIGLWWVWLGKFQRMLFMILVWCYVVLVFK